MAAHETQAYQDPGTPEEQSRRQFLVNATLASGGIIGLVLTIPLVGSLIPESLLKPGKSQGGVWTALPPEDAKKLEASTNAPVKINFSFKYEDGYLPPADDTTPAVWGIKLTPEQQRTFHAKRPDLFEKQSGKVDFNVLTMGFVIFSAICPHLGCRYEWHGEAKRFICPCHGSQFGIQGEKLAGPTPRGLDPLPFREKNGKAEVTWIQYKAQQPDRLIVAYS